MGSTDKLLKIYNGQVVSLDGIIKKCDGCCKVWYY